MSRFAWGDTPQPPCPGPPRENLERVTPLVVLPLAGRARRPTHSAFQIALRDVLDVGTARQRTAVESVAEEPRHEGILVRKKPRFHALHHKVRMLFRGSVRPVPVVVFSQVGPGCSAVSHGRLAVHQQYDEVVFPRTGQCGAEVVPGIPPAAGGENPRHAPGQSRLAEQRAEALSASFLRRPDAAAPFDVHDHVHQRFPPMPPEAQNSPSRYRSSHSERPSPFRRFMRVRPSCFSQTTTLSGVSVNPSTSVSEWVVTSS